MSNSKDPRWVLCVRVTAYAVVIFVLPIIAIKGLPLMDRAVVVLENMDQRVERAFDGAAPLGKEMVEKGCSAVEAMDTQELSDGLKSGAKEVGNELKERFKRTLRSKEAPKKE